MKNLFSSLIARLKQRRRASAAVGAVLLVLALAAFFFFHVPTEDQRFSRFTESLFREELSGNTLNLHYTLAFPQNYGIDDYSISLGSAEPEACLRMAASCENTLHALNRIDSAQLSPENQLTWKILKAWLELEKEGGGYILYQEPLSPTLGIQAQLPILLAEYTFRTRQDIQDYLGLLGQVPDYFSSILELEKAKAKAGLFMSDTAAGHVIEQCQSFISDPENHYLITVFDQTMDRFSNLTADEKISYKQQNSQLVQGHVIPAYERLIEELTALRKSLYGAAPAEVKENGSLSRFPDGQAYYEYLVRLQTGDFSGLEAIEEKIRHQLAKDFNALQNLVAENPDLASEMEPAADSGAALPVTLLSRLRDTVTQDFPEPPAVSCEIKYVDDSLSNYLSPAFYLTPPIDDTSSHVIYLNPTNSLNTMELYTTLAHEGYPGHLYQTIYSASCTDDPIRSVISFGGYTEGWATYVEMYAYSTWSENPRLAKLCQLNRSLMLGISSILDIGIHYYGYTRQNVADYLSRLGLNAASADSLYDTIAEAPANYLKYYVGYLNFSSMQERTKEKMGNAFTLKSYHEQVLRIGPAPFSILEECLGI